MVSVTIPAGTKAVDLSSTGHPLSWYEALLLSGVEAVFLDSLSPGVATDIANALAAGLTVNLFQGYYTPAWAIPSEATTRAQQIVRLAQQGGLPAKATPPVVLWLDLEACGNVPASAIFPWVTNWGQVVQSGGYDAGVYVGAGQPLTGRQLYDIPTITHYWRSASKVPDVATRGYQILQGAWNQSFEGVPVDYDTIQADRLGSLPVGVALSAGPTNAVVAQLQQQVTQLAQQLQNVQSAQSQVQHALTTLQQQLATTQQDVAALQAMVTAIKHVFAN
ncbi:glycoside hydrolase domain-containing protein [Sulfobacillus harzensis]|uniref:DUF1906 domain-containing protein n=1 Tax=Sulfobacillus harzensis TaxID=2729629 RepID=A0A7Y0L030_9FIRM|nr:glycoside hydrolase domain-containing protein [Sulfobacillus harzensis]NMP20798.1 DUF1906 domain-containing protein [Sulfobacillus harzensis]